VARPGRKLFTFIHALAAGGDYLELLRCGSTQAVLGHRVMAVSTVGRWLRAFTFGHVRQLDRVCGEILGRSGRRVPGPGSDHLTGRKTVCQLAMIQASRTSSNCLKPSPLDSVSDRQQRQSEEDRPVSRSRIRNTSPCQVSACGRLRSRVSNDRVVCAVYSSWPTGSGGRGRTPDTGTAPRARLPVPQGTRGHVVLAGRSQR
jgi:hypothetical protein